MTTKRKAHRARKAQATIPVEQETVEQHARRLGCFSPAELALLLQANVSHAKLDQLARAK